MIVGLFAGSVPTEVSFIDAVIILSTSDIALDRTTFTAFKSALETSTTHPETCRSIADMMDTMNPAYEIVAIRKAKTAKIFKEFGGGKTLTKLQDGKTPASS